MGLDAVELVMEVEEDFKIKINDRDAEKIRTVGELHDYIVERLPPGSPWSVTPAGQSAPVEPCLTAVAFFRLRRVFVEISGHAREAIRPSTLINERLPTWRRRRLWKHAREKLGLKMPGIGYSSRMLTIMAAVSGAIALGIAVLCGADRHEFSAWLVGSFAAAFALLVLALRPLACEIEIAHTFGDLARWIAVQNHNSLCAAVGANSPQSIWGRLVAIVSHQLCVDPMIIRPESSFVNDLGAG